MADEEVDARDGGPEERLEELRREGFLEARVTGSDLSLMNALRSALVRFWTSSDVGSFSRNAMRKA